MKKTLLIGVALCFMMSAMAQKSNDKTLFEQFKMKAKKVEQINRSATSYTQKIDSIVDSGSKEVMQYDQNLNCTKITLYYANKAEKGWDLSEITDYEYDAQNRVISQTTGYFRTTYEYNADGLLSAERMWAKNGGEWTEIHYMTYEYNTDGLLAVTRIFARAFNEYNNWYEDQRVEYTYSNGVPTLALYYYWVIDIQGFEIYNRTTWDYNNQLCTKKEEWSWNNIEWILDSRIEYQYYDNGNLLEESYSRSEVYGGEMIYSYKMQYQYDDHNNVTVLSHYNYQENNGEFDWVLEVINEMEYDMNVPASSIAGFAVRYGFGPDSYYQDKLLKITTSNMYGYSEEQHIYYSPATTTPTGQTSTLSQGWNWFSANVEITLDDLKAALVEASSGNTSITIKAKDNKSTKYTNGNWRGSLRTLDVALMYMINVETNYEITIEGMPINPAAHPITITPGINWIGFPFNESMTPAEAFAGFAVNNDQIKAKNNQFTKYTNGNWRGSLRSLEPGQGYIYNSNRTEPVDFIYGGGTNSHEYVDLGLPSGLLWATCNVGADTPEGYGDYFAWGETQPKDIYNWSTYQYCNGSGSTLTKYCSNSSYGYNGFTDDLTILLPEDDAATANWGTGWRMPTEAEWEELRTYTTHTWTTQNGVSGRLFTASNGNSIFLPAAGKHLNYPGNAGSYGYYWASPLCTNYPEYTWGFQFNSLGHYVGTTGFRRDVGFSVRAVREN